MKANAWLSWHFSLGIGLWSSCFRLASGMFWLSRKRLAGLPQLQLAVIEVFGAHQDRIVARHQPLGSIPFWIRTDAAFTAYTNQGSSWGFMSTPAALTGHLQNVGFGKHLEAVICFLVCNIDRRHRFHRV